VTTTSGATLAEQLRAAGKLPAGWASAVAAVRRERFIPDRIWVDEGGDDDIECVPLDRAAEPARWQDAVRSNKVIVTQFDDGATSWPQVGYRPTCSSSMPSAMLGMLEVLDVHDGHRVLEIGTGTGYNAALLAQRAATVTTVEVDPGIAEQARTALRDLPTVQVVTADGTVGRYPGAPFDRVLATAAVRFGQLPDGWVAQARPGGVIVAPVHTDLATGPLVRFTVNRDGTATGHAATLRVRFMELRSHRAPSRWQRLRWDDPAADLTHSDRQPWTALLAEAPRWAIAVAVPQCRYDVWKRTPERPHGVAWLVDTCSGSWASVVPGGTTGRYDVRQYGPRRLWDEAESAHRWWQQAGEPALEDWEFIITSDRQTVRPRTPNDGLRDEG
jgi:protein-L-isoaspartate O-methyltransferase